MWLADPESLREHCLGRKHRRRLQGAVVPSPALPNRLLHLCRDALWAIYVRCAVRLARLGSRGID
eukprot:11227921-Lingulodinium_polyedra.AAC.1